MIYFRKIFIVISLIVFLLPFHSYSVGVHYLINYKRSEYKAGQQIWSIASGSNGMMYFANNNGLLEFDGTNWNLYHNANYTSIRSILSYENNIYAGGSNEIGYFSTNQMGETGYQSLTQLLPAAVREFGDVWRIFSYDSRIVFQSFNYLMIYANGQFTVIPAVGEFHLSFKVNGTYYVNDLKYGLMEFKADKLVLMKGTETVKGKEIMGILPFQDKLLIATVSDGLFLFDGQTTEFWRSEANDFLTANQVYSCLKIDDETFAFGTIQDGLLICNQSGAILNTLNRDNGLQNNTILSIQNDFAGNLWLGTDNGIDYLEINSPLTMLSKDYGLSTGYSAAIYDGRLFLGTNQGLFETNWEYFQNNTNSYNAIKLIKEIKGQVWFLDIIDDVLFCGNHSGTSIIDQEKIIKLNDIQGGWIYLQVPDHPDKIIGGTYSGLTLFEKRRGEWQFVKKYEGFNESSRKMVFDEDGTLWMTHGLKGVYHIFFNENYAEINKVVFYSTSSGLPSEQGINVAILTGKLIFTTPYGIYRYDKITDNFVADSVLNRFFNNHIPRTITVDKSENIWYFDSESVGVLRMQEDRRYIDVRLPFVKLNGSFIGGFEFVLPYNDENVFIANEYGFVHYNPLFKKEYRLPLNAYVRKMTINKDSVIIPSIVSSEKPIMIDFKNNNVEFLFSANDFENNDKLLYTTWLEGFENNWTGWVEKPYREFTNLNEGIYTFHLKARNIYGAESGQAEIKFKVLPPWRRSITAYVLYFIFAVLSFYFAIRFLKLRIKKSKQRSELKQKEIYEKRAETIEKEKLKAEKSLAEIKNQQLTAQMMMRDKELANQTMRMIQNNEFFISLRKNLENITNQLENKEDKYAIRSTIQKINKNIESDNQWKIFEMHFEDVHEEFLKRIKAEFPALSPRELKLCAYLRMNISSKEIALLMNISTRGVEISRYRLRKKLNLSTDVNLSDFIITY